MKSKKKINPRRRPATAADVQRAKDKAADNALMLSIAIFLTVLKDKFGFDNDQICEAWQAMDKLSEEVMENRVNLYDLKQVLADEYKIDLS